VLGPGVEVGPERQQRRPDLGGARLDHVEGGLGLPPDHGGDARAQDAGLFAGDLFDGVAEELAVIEVHGRDHRHRHALDHVGGVQHPAQAHLQQAQVRLGLAEGQEGAGGGDLEEGDWLAGVGRLDPVEHLGERRLLDQPPGHADALGEAHQVRRGVDVDLQPRRLGHGAQEGDGGALAVGPRHMDHRRQLSFRVTQRRAQPAHAVERQVDLLGMQRLQPRQRRVVGQEAVGHGRRRRRTWRP